ncbi:hypothetical protein NHF46_06580 [Arthrobacter alpinus]|nr:hypothetical protein [Arthrobacter alpinus]
MAATATDAELPATNTVVAPDGQASDGLALDSTDFNGQGKRAAKRGLYALDNADLFNLLCIPPYQAGASGGPNDGDIEYGALVPDAVAYCQARRAVLVLDSPHDWSEAAEVVTGMANQVVATTSNYAVLYFPGWWCRIRCATTGPGNWCPAVPWLESWPAQTVAGVSGRRPPAWRPQSTAPRSSRCR